MFKHKILFLDFDGVLNNAPWAHSGIGYGGFDSPLTKENAKLDPENVKQLIRVLEETGCFIVISSNWRNTHSTGSFGNLFAEYGIPPYIVIDKTPQGAYNQRGIQIQSWLDNNRFTGNYAIVDDFEQMLDSQLAYFIRTNDLCGLTEADAVRLIEILNRE